MTWQKDQELCPAYPHSTLVDKVGIRVRLKFSELDCVLSGAIKPHRPHCSLLASPPFFSLLQALYSTFLSLHLISGSPSSLLPSHIIRYCWDQRQSREIQVFSLCLHLWSLAVSSPTPHKVPKAQVGVSLEKRASTVGCDPKIHMPPQIDLVANSKVWDACFVERPSSPVLSIAWYASTTGHDRGGPQHYQASH